MGKVEARYTRSHLVRTPSLFTGYPRTRWWSLRDHVHWTYTVVAVASCRRVVAFTARYPQRNGILEFGYSMKNCLPPCVGTRQLCADVELALIIPSTVDASPNKSASKRIQMKIKQNERREQRGGKGRGVRERERERDSASPETVDAREKVTGAETREGIGGAFPRWQRVFIGCATL